MGTNLFALVFLGTVTLALLGVVGVVWLAHRVLTRALQAAKPRVPLVRGVHRELLLDADRMLRDMHASLREARDAHHAARSNFEAARGLWVDTPPAQRVASQKQEPRSPEPAPGPRKIVL